MSDEYDEFGNYIGDIEGDPYGFDDFVLGGESADAFAGEAEEDGVDNGDNMEVVESGSQAIVLAEDKKYYPDADEVYPGVATATMTEDAQDIETPLVDPMLSKNIYHAQTTQLPTMEHDTEYVSNLMSNPALIRHVAVIGHIHHGKTSVVHNLFESVKNHQQQQGGDGKPTAMMHGVRPDEESRGISLKTTVTCMPLQNCNGKHYLMNLLDCPGHSDFFEDCMAAHGTVDGVMVVVDALEGLMGGTEKMIKSALELGNRLTLVINKVDRLILELRLPPEDAYLKLAHTIADVNAFIAKCSSDGTGSSSSSSGNKVVQVLSPERGNVCFASTLHGWSFSLQSFALLYCQRHNSSKRGGGAGKKAAPSVDSDNFALRLWGQWYFHEDSRTIKKERVAGSASASSRTFVHYLLKPLYKVYSHVMGDEVDTLQSMLRSHVGLKVPKHDLQGNPSDVLKCVLSQMFGFAGSIVSMLAKTVPSPLAGSARKVSLLYSGAADSATSAAMTACKAGSSGDGDSTVTFMAHVTKTLFHYEDREFYALARIYSGQIKAGQAVQVLGNAYSPDDPEDSAPATVTQVCVGVGQHFVDMGAFPDCAVAGNIVLLKGVDGSISKGATLVGGHTSPQQQQGVSIFKNPNYTVRSVMSVALEPLKPADLPKMVDGLRSVCKAYPAVYTRVEESGEHVLFGTGEMSLDCATHDLRLVYSPVEIKIAQPFCSLRETVVDTSSLQCFASTANGRNRFTGTAEPLDKGLSTDLEAGVVRFNDNHVDQTFMRAHLKKKFNWDSLATNSIWAFGPDSSRANVLLDDTLPTEVDKKVLQQTKSSIVQGFQWGTREGPLCDEPMRDVKFKILDASLDSSAIQRGGGQVIPAARRLVYSSFLVATPRLMEPVYAVEIQATSEMTEAVSKVLSRRRGHVVRTAPKPGAPFHVMNAYLPVIESIGFQVDLRTFTQGQVFAQQDFDHWAVAPGDPMDPNVILHPLEPSPPLALSRDFMLKTRRRKGLPEDVSFARFFDDSMLLMLNESAAEA